jgi:tRNA U34 5-methylaminomethyl-2-thiouridine-forming methyltransferase MnmC
MPLLRDSTLYSPEFQDIYYNPTDGLAESRTVFVEGVSLKDTFTQQDYGNLVETGFGTGLNFLLTWQSLLEMGNTKPFTYTSIEGFPLPRSLLELVYAQPLFEPLAPLTQSFLKLYPETPTPQQVLTLTLSPWLTLNLVLYPIKEALRYLPEDVNYWYLDGFSPKTNPDMWSRELFEAMRLKSASLSRVATFTASRVAKEGLTHAGFNWERIKGFGRKRHRLVGIHP